MRQALCSWPEITLGLLIPLIIQQKLSFENYGFFFLMFVFSHSAAVFSACLTILNLKTASGQRVAGGRLLFSAFMKDDFPQIEFIQREVEIIPPSVKRPHLIVSSLIASAITHAGDNAAS